MDLLFSYWIPIHNQGVKEKITLQQLLCGEKTGELCLPRDDMELACLQLLAAITQVCFTPPDRKALLSRLKQPLTADQFFAGIDSKKEWFDLNHPETPFMQVRGVKSAQPTTMDKLLAGVADGTSKTFINPDGLGSGLCASCVAIALFNTANNCPSMGGGFKGSLRGSTPITQLISGPTLRQTVWLNVLHKERLNQVMPWYADTEEQQPNYLEPVQAGATIPAASIGLARGLLWQPAHFELLPAAADGCCSLCGEVDKLLTAFNKAKFNYTIAGVWPHPLSARTFKIAKGIREEKFLSFTTSAPGWIYLSRLVMARQSDKEGQSPAPVLDQAREELVKGSRLQFVIGGYRNNQATVLERRHEFFSLASGWADHSSLIDHIVSTGLGYKTALRKALYLFAVGIKDKIRGAGINLCEPGDALYFQQTGQYLHQVLGTIDFQQPEPFLTTLHQQLRQTVLRLFEQVTRPYRQEPKMLKALALARRSLNKSLAELIPEASREEV